MSSLPARLSPRATLPDVGAVLAWVAIVLVFTVGVVLAVAYVGQAADLSRQCAQIGPNDLPACVGAR